MDFMSILVDVLGVVLILMGIAKGAKNGFLKTLISTVSIVVSAIAAILLRPLIYGIFNSVGLVDSLKKIIATNMSQSAAEGTEATISNTLSNIQIPDSLRSTFEENIVITDGDITNSASSYIATFIVNSLSIIVGFLACMVVIALIIKLTDILTKLPVIGSVDRLLGGILGIVAGVVSVYCLALLISALATAGIAVPVADAIDRSYVVKFLLDYFPITMNVVKSTFAL